MTTVPISSPSTDEEIGNYEMRISRMTIDKLGVRLYDTVSAVVAELVANSHDADATQVTIRLPSATTLAKRGGQKNSWVDQGFVIEVVDNGHGMTPHEAQEHFLHVGRERRRHASQGAVSRAFRRPVMGRKGIGKLAPFGICRRIEVRSSGGEKSAMGYRVANFVMDFDKIVSDSPDTVVLDKGLDDGTFSNVTGTSIKLSQFLGKRVPDTDTFLRQLARRFVPQRDFQVSVEDARSEPATLHQVGPLDVPINEATRIDLATRPVLIGDGEKLTVSGWLALAKDAYKDEETTGVRIYARGKIVGWTRDFEQPAGYTGEFTMRSYLVGEVNAEWLDLDDGEDLVKTDRQGIIWDSEYGDAFRSWGAALIKEMGKLSRKPRRERVSEIFLETSRIEERAKQQFEDPEVVEAALELASTIGGFAAEDELGDDSYVDDVAKFILSVAPHTALMKAFKAFDSAVSSRKVTQADLRTLFGKTRVAELASYGLIARERVQAIKNLEKLVLEESNETDFQNLIADAPWLIEPTWSVISENQALSTFKQSFELWFEKTRRTKVSLAIRNERKRPDFTLVHLGSKLFVVEIKAGQHVFGDSDFERLLNYVDPFDEFFTEHKAIRDEFPLGYQINLIADSVQMTKSANRHAFESAREKGKLVRLPWLDFLNNARKSHEEFLRTSELLTAAENASEAS
jgi:Histidine kinase-, DNA gyrase B-, and HSP90-like ATPase